VGGGPPPPPLVQGPEEGRQAGGLLPRNTVLHSEEGRSKCGFETRSSGGTDDVDLQYRLLRDGHRLAVSTVVSEHIKNQSLREFFAYRVYMGSVRNGYFLKYRFSYLKYFPLTMEAYWVLVSLAEGAFRLIPYHLVNGVAQTLGFIEGT
jgi:hypothetical protein